MTAPNYYCAPAFKIGATSYEITDGSWKFDPQLEELMSTESFFSAFTIGNLNNVSFTIKSNDGALALLAYKGTEHAEVQLLFKRSALTPGADQTAHTFATGAAGWKISNCRVTECVEWSGGADKKNAEYSITFKAAKKSSDNSDPTITKVTE